ncbi:hypothetical protein RUM44_013957 [Polyplax serrata]|uniref:Uncharacterized protein n=1 Tax=Polyplax serrata TaxID=468196 RepID=A0ABR1BJI7_POLSC
MLACVYQPVTNERLYDGSVKRLTSTPLQIIRLVKSQGRSSSGKTNECNLRKCKRPKSLSSSSSESEQSDASKSSGNRTTRRQKSRVILVGLEKQAIPSKLDYTWVDHTQMAFDLALSCPTFETQHSLDVIDVGH